MIKLFGIAAIALTIITAGCGADNVREAHLTTFPSVGSTATRNIGSPLLQQGYGVVVPNLILEKPATIGKFVIPEGEYMYDEDDSEGTYFSGFKEDFYMRPSDGALCIEDTGVCAPAKYKIEKSFTATGDAIFQQTLLYNGKSGSTITLGYREFSNGLARPAFSNTATYDLGDSKVVGYKGARLKVLNATNTEITYKVLSGFYSRTQ